MQLRRLPTRSLRNKKFPHLRGNRWTMVLRTGKPSAVRAFQSSPATMKNFWILRIILSAVTLAVLSCPVSAEILKIVVDDTIQPISEEYIARALAEAARRNDQAILIEINTPGGLVDSKI